MYFKYNNMHQVTITQCAINNNNINNNINDIVLILLS